MVLEKTFESPLNSKEIQPVHPKGNQSWRFIGRTDAEAEAPILWPPDVKTDSLKRPLCWERLKTGGEGDDRGWDSCLASPTQWLEFEQTPGDGEGLGSLACCSPWGHKESDTTERLNWTELNALDVGLWRKLSAEELMLLNYGVREDSWEPLGLQGDPISPS